MENLEMQKPGFLDQTPSFSDVPAFLAVLGSPGIVIFTRLDLGDRVVTLVMLTRFDLGDRIVTI